MERRAAATLVPGRAQVTADGAAALSCGTAYMTTTHKPKQRQLCIPVLVGTCKTPQSAVSLKCKRTAEHCACVHRPR